MTGEVTIYHGGVTEHGSGSFPMPALIKGAGERAGKRFQEFFGANIRNENTRAAYLCAVRSFSAWCVCREITLKSVEPLMVAAYIDELGLQYTPPTVKQHLAGLRMLFDWLVVGQVIPFNPASSVRGPRYSIKKGKTRVCDPEELRTLFATFDTETLVGLRDRALIAIMLYSFARVSAVVGMNVEDYAPAGMRSMVLRLHEKGGKFHEVPAHHLVVKYLDQYLETARLKGTGKAPLFQTIHKKRKSFTGRRLTRHDAWALVKRRCGDASIPTTTSPHSFRASGITIFLQNDGDIESAAAIAAHESVRTTKLYDRTNDAIEQSEIERIRL